MEERTPKTLKIGFTTFDLQENEDGTIEINCFSDGWTSCNITKDELEQLKNGTITPFDLPFK